MNDRHLKLKDAIEVVRETVADEYIESTLELRLLDKSLTADVVEVVRCKDCKYSSPNKVYGCRLEPFNTLENGERMYSNDFCSYGKKRDD